MAGAGVTWRIYYDGGGTYSSADGCPASAPAFGILAIVQQDEREGRHVLAGCHYYWFQDGRWLGGDFAGLLDLLTQVWCLVKAGRMVPSAVYDAALRAASNDRDFPARGAWRTNEGDVRKGVSVS